MTYAFLRNSHEVLHLGFCKSYDYYWRHVFLFSFLSLFFFFLPLLFSFFFIRCQINSNFFSYHILDGVYCAYVSKTFHAYSQVCFSFLLLLFFYSFLLYHFLLLPLSVFSILLFHRKPCFLSSTHHTRSQITNTLYHRPPSQNHCFHSPTHHFFFSSSSSKCFFEFFIFFF